MNFNKNCAWIIINNSQKICKKRECIWIFDKTFLREWMLRVNTLFLDIMHNDVLNVSISIKRVQRTNIPKNGLIWSTDNVCYIFSDDTQENNCLTLEKAFTSRRVFVPIRTLQLQFFFPCYIIIVNICVEKCESTNCFMIRWKPHLSWYLKVLGSFSPI